MRPISENHGNQKNPICAGLIRSRWVLFLVLLPLFRWSVPAGEEPWERMAAPGTSSSRMTPALWQNCPPLTAGTKVKIFEAQGPGVITLFHVSALGTNFGQGFDSEASQSVKIRVFYDGEQSPSIEMPLMDFLADIQCQSAYFQTKYFSKVKEAHNFRLPMPFPTALPWSWRIRPPLTWLATRMSNGTKSGDFRRLAGTCGFNTARED